MTEVAVISVQGREYLTGQTLGALMGRGGLGATGMRARLFWSGTREAPAYPGWEVVTSGIERPASLSVLRIFEACDPKNDLLFFEDDVIPCVNAVPVAASVGFPGDAGLISFFDYRCEWPSPGLFIAPKRGRHLWGSQALKIPARVVQALIPMLRKKIGEDRVAGLMTPKQANWDTWMGQAVEELGLGIYHYSPTLFQHGGAKCSVANEGVHHPYAKNFPGENWDATQVCPDPVPEGIFTEYFKPCIFHGVTHPRGVVCRYWPIKHEEQRT